MKLIDWHDLNFEIFLRPWILKVISFGLILVIIYNLVTGFLFFQRMQETIQNQDTTVHNQSQINENEILSRQSNKLFGQYEPKSLNDSGVVNSILNLTVVGVLVSSTSESSQVILKDSHGSEKVYHIGDKLAGGGVIKRIMPEGILILRDGVLERLMFSKNALKFEQLKRLEEQ